MASKNRTPELVSLLQYMKNTNLNNPNILVQDERIKRLDSVVTEVKESEEWEVVGMSIYSVAWSHGEEAGKTHGKKIGREHGEKRGREIGERIGKETILIEQICKNSEKPSLLKCSR